MAHPEESKVPAVDCPVCGKKFECMARLRYAPQVSWHNFHSSSLEKSLHCEELYDEHIWQYPECMKLFTRARRNSSVWFVVSVSKRRNLWRGTRSWSIKEKGHLHAPFATRNTGTSMGLTTTWKPRTALKNHLNVSSATGSLVSFCPCNAAYDEQLKNGCMFILSNAWPNSNLLLCISLWFQLSRTTWKNMSSVTTRAWSRSGAPNVTRNSSLQVSWRCTSKFTWKVRLRCWEKQCSWHWKKEHLIEDSIDIHTADKIPPLGLDWMGSRRQ